MAVRYLLLLPLVAIVAVGCSDSDSPSAVRPEVTIDQKYLFDIYYINFAWGYRLSGTLIDDQGNVVEYDHSFEPWDAEDYSNLTEAELDEKYVARQDTIAVIDAETLSVQYSKIKAASFGELSERVPCGADMGALSVVCYMYDEKTERYGRVLLALTGDYEQTNLSDEAAELRSWLESVLPEFFGIN